MAVSLSLIARERRKWLKNLRPSLRKVDSASNALLREIDRIVKRKRQMPEESDLVDLLNYCGNVLTEIETVTKTISDGYIQ